MKDIRVQEITKPHKFDGKRWSYIVELRDVEVMAISGKYAMVRRKGALPYVCMVKELSQK